jgi:hypothetical protein
MHCQYRDICKEHNCRAKIYTQPNRNLEDMIGRPDLIVLFTNPTSHELARVARRKAAGCGIPIVQSHSGSGNALRNILRDNIELISQG